MTDPADPADPGAADAAEALARSRAEREARLAALLRIEVPEPGAGAVPGVGHAPGDPGSTGGIEPTPEPGSEERADGVDDRAVPAPTSRPGRIGRVVSASVLVALVASGLALVWAGADLLRSSTEGELVAPERDPAAPGYEALIQPTPTLALLHDLDGEVDAITVLTLPDPSAGGGAVVAVPTRVVVEIPILGVTPIEAGYDLGSPSVQAEAVGDLLGAGIGEVAVVDATRWADLVAPVAPLTIDNPDEIVVDDEVRFALGEIELAADDVGPYLESRIEGESDLARLFRHQVFWQAWLDAVRDDGGVAAVPGELETGVGRFVRTLAAGEAELDTLPVVDPGPGARRFGDEATFLPDADEIDDLVARVVPFPRSPRPGVRPRVRVLNGTTDTDEAARIAPRLAPAGVEVVLVGNAGTLDVAETSIAYVEPDQRDEAEEIASILGVGRVVQDPRPSDAVDITVTLGADHD